MGSETVVVPASRLVQHSMVATSRRGLLRRYAPSFAALLLYSTLFSSPAVACAQGLVIPAAPDAAGTMHLGTVGEIAISGLDEMETRLQFATVEQAANLLERLGVEPEAAREAAEHSRQESKIRLEAEPDAGRYAPPQDERALLFLPDTVQGNAEVVLLLRRHDGARAGPWHGVDRRSIDQFAHAASYEWLVLEGAPRPLLALHHVNSGHGSNFSGRLLGADTVEHARWSAELVERRFWRWNAAQGRFLAGAFQTAGTR